MSIKKKQTLLCFFAIVTLIGTLILAPACSEENIITVNPSSEPLTREETRAMTEKAAAAFYADPALRDELESEITLKMEIVPAEGLPDDELAVYTLTHGGNSRCFFMETFGEPDENGDFAILFHPALVDVSRPVTVRTGDAVCTVQVNPSEEFLEASIRENGDPELACVGRIMYSEIVSPAR